MKKVLVGAVRINFPEDLADGLRDLAEVVYESPREESHFMVLKEADALIAGMEMVDNSFLDGAPRLGIVARFGVGYDSINVEALHQAGHPRHLHPRGSLGGRRRPHVGAHPVPDAGHRRVRRIR